MNRKFFVLALVLLISGFSAFLFADDAAKAPIASPVVTAAQAQAPAPAPINAGDTAWVLISAALVMLMTPGLAFFYGGLVRKKNMLSILMQCMVALAALSVQWVLFGYSLAFHPGNGFWGGFGWFGLKGVGFEPYADYAGTIPHQAFMIFQAMFAIITPALIIGAFAERMKFSSYLIFLLLWSTFIYDPIAHWVWGVGGFLKNMGALDFAGGTVVHITSGVSALVCALYLGKRVGYPREPMPPHSVVISFIGACLLWVGWFGFNAGSALSSGSLATSAFVATHFGAAAAVVGWTTAEWIRRGKPSALGAISGSVAGLVAITPASGFVSPMSALAIGLVAGVVCFLMTSSIKARLGYDDSLDAFGVHGVGGTVGALLTGVFASSFINPIFKDANGNALASGAIQGNFHQILNQLMGVAIAWVIAIVGTVIILKIVDLAIGLRVSEEDEAQGLDLTQHGEDAYHWGTSS